MKTQANIPNESAKILQNTNTSTSNDSSSYSKKRATRAYGWTPMSYPSSALYNSEKEELNPFFPLHKNVIQAAVRELLILDQVMDATSLELVETQVEEPKEKKTRKRKRNTGNHVMKQVIIDLNQEKRKNLDHANQDTTTASEISEQDSKEAKAKQQLVTPEELTQVVLDKIANCWHEEISTKEKGESTLLDSKKIRKVSDADAMTVPSVTVISHHNIDSQYAAHLAVAATNMIHQDHNTINLDTIIQQLEKMFPSASQKDLLKNLYKKNQIPNMLDLSIIVEAHLRQIAFEKVKTMGTFISDLALREFLGYKSPTAKYERVMELMSDFLFDVSHAMFAWEKTERDIDASNTQTIQDATICKTLFDSRALRKIGGFEPTSLLYHALSINRLEAKGESWAEFAKTPAGKKMFSHHRDNLSRIEAGTKRRDKRMKKNLAGVYPIMMEDRDDGRSRSVSVASIDSPSHAVKTPSSQVEEKSQAGENSTTEKKESRSHTCISPGIPDITSVSITRKEVSEDWFTQATGIFKRSHSLDLELRRIQS
ncbi:hypothetical protein CTEN210_11509 [Chaetoceros tenuissimus]|uniref:Uncharacterized protein n=1 Tax=Chaetoceros tenuissimus TaxID=426638 RepID=A0AAD3CZS7_9STRA|nr:hypothetical protein CTEN210_11509 [Chaetoceros tenuissimus]